MKLEEQIGRARADIAHRCDGPLTCFVLICRAVEMAAAGMNPVAVSNALVDELESRNMLKPEHLHYIEVPGS